MKVVTWDAANGRYKEIVTGRVITAGNLPPDLADGDIWIDTSSPTDPVTWAKVGGVVYEVVGSGWLEEILGEAVMEIHGGPMDDYPVTDTVTYPSTATETPTSSFITPQLATTITGLSPAGYWRLSDAASPPQDSSGFARHASATTSVTYRNTQGGGAAVDAVSTYPTLVTASKIPVADVDAWSPTTTPGMTIFFLARPTVVPSSVYNTFISKGTTGVWEWSIEYQATGSVWAYTMTAAGALVRRSETPFRTVEINRWHAICVTISDGTTGATIDVYKDSGTALSKTVVTGAGSAANGTGVLQIGAQTDVATRGMIGSMAHVAIFSGVMSGANITTIMDAARSDGWIV